MLIGESLLTRIQYTPGQQIHLPVVGAIEQDHDMAEGEEYPEVRIQMAGGTVISAVGKQGVAVKFTEEILRYASGYQVIDLHITAAVRSLARYKERKIWSLLLNQGVITHDNDTPTNSMFGITTGRDLVGAANGSLMMDDLFDAYSALLYNGYTPNVLIMHPLTWLMFVKDPILRAFALNSGGGTFFATWSGNPADKDAWPEQSGGMGMATGRQITPPTATNGTPSALTAYSQRMEAGPVLPQYGSFAPFDIIVTPFMPYDPADNSTDIIMADRNELGFYIVDETLQTIRTEDLYRDILYIKMRERYDLAIKNEGQAIAVLRGVRVVPNEIVLPAQTTIPVNGSLSELNRNTAI
jgi:hypothetical protein